MKPVELDYLIKNGTKATLEKITADLVKVGSTGTESSDAISKAMARAEVKASLLRDLISRLETELSNLQTANPNIDQTANIARAEELERAIKSVRAELEKTEKAGGDTNVVPSSLPNAKKEFDGLHFSIQQMAREIPSLAMGPQMFFLAISNNLPMFTDELARAKKEYAATVASGEKGTPVWRRVAGSLISWQTLMTTGIMLLVMYGAKVVDFFKNLASGNKSITESALALEDFRTKVAEATADSLTKYNALQKGWERLGDSLEAKKAFVENNKEAFEELGVSVKDVADAEEVLVNRADDFIEMLKNKAMATAAFNLATEKNKEALTKGLEADNLEISKPLVDETATAVSPYGVYTYKTGNKIANPLIAQKRKEANELREIAVDYIEQSEKFKEAEDRLSEGIGGSDGNNIGNKEKERELEKEILAQRQKADSEELELNKLRARNKIEAIEIERDAKIEAINREKDAYAALYAETHNGEMADTSDFDRQIGAVTAIAKREISDINNYQRGLEVARYNRIADDYASLEEKRAKLREEYDRKITLAQKMGDDDLVSKLKVGLEVELQDVDEEGKKNQKILDEYRTFAERYKILKEEFESDKISITSAGGDDDNVAVREEQYNKDLESLNNEFLNSSVVGFEELAKNITDANVNQIINLLKEAKEAMIKEGKDAKGSEVAAINSTITKLENRKPDVSPGQRSIKDWTDLQGQLNDCISSFEEMGDSIGGVAGEIIGAAGEIAGSTITIVNGVIQLVNGSIAGVTASAKAGASAIKAVETASVILAIIGAVISVVTKLYNLIDGKKQKALQDEIDMYNELVSTYDTLIDKQKELLANSMESQALTEYNEALDMIDAKQDAAAASLRSWFNTKESGMLWWKTLQGEAFDENFGGKLSRNELFDMDSKEWERWMVDNAETWAALPEEVRNYAQAIMDSGVQTEELQSAWNEFMTGFSIDDARRDLLDFLEEFDSTAETVSENFEEYLTNAINNVVANGLDEELVAWYEKLSKAMEGGLTEEERAALQSEYERILKKASEERDAAYDVVGYDPKDDVTVSQSGKTGAFETMTQDQGTKLEGLFTASEMRIARIEGHSESVVAQMDTAVGHLAKISEFTESSSISLKSLEDKVGQIIRDGLKMN